jgi:hypothetical protein
MIREVETDMLEAVARKERTIGETEHHPAKLHEIHMMEEVARKEKHFQVHTNTFLPVLDEIRRRGSEGNNALRKLEPQILEEVARKERERPGHRPPKYWRDEMQGVNTEVEFLGKMEELIKKM